MKISWTLLWNERQRCWENRRWCGRVFPRLSGIVWRKGSLCYKKAAGPITLFHHVLNENLRSMYFSQKRTWDFFKGNPLLVSSRDSLPVHSGNTIQFFTYKIGED